MDSDVDSPQPTADSMPFAAMASEAAVDSAAQIAALDMPLPRGLRAAAQEAASWRLAAGLRALAGELERGRPLEDCLAEGARRLPRHMAGLVRAAQRTGDTGLALAEWMANRRAARQHWHGVVSALAYPAIAAILAIAVFMLFATLVVQPFKQMYEEFGLKLPLVTTYLFRTSEFGGRVVPVTLGALALAAIGTRVFGGRSGWSCLVSNLPLVGHIWHWIGVAEALRCLSLLVEHRVPLAESLRLTADGVSDAYVGDQCRLLAGRVEQGRSLTMSLVDLRSLPLSIVPFVHWGERQNLLAEGLRSAAEMIEGRLRLRTDVLLQILPPLIFLAIGVMLANAVIALFLPLISLIQGLS
jgi:type II secretory pathway component PulF